MLVAARLAIMEDEAMPHYYFHIVEGDELIDDPEGVDLPDESAARERAIMSARSLLSAAVIKGSLPLDHAIVVADEKRATLFELSFGEAVGIR